MDNIYKNIEEYNPIKKRIVLIVFDDMICLVTKKPNLIVTELFIIGTKLNIPHVFITESSYSKNYKTKFYAQFCYENSK